MIISKVTFDKIITSYPQVPPEQGGIIGSKNNIVCEYFHDEGLQNHSNAVYEPTVFVLNRQIERWSAKSIEFSGIVHSHMSHEKELSGADVEYIEKMFAALPLTVERLYFPLVFPELGEVIAYLAERAGSGVIIKEEPVTLKP